MVLYFQKKEVTINPSFDINIKDEMDDETIYSTVSFEIEANHEGLNDREDVMVNTSGEGAGGSGGGSVTQIISP